MARLAIAALSLVLGACSGGIVGNGGGAPVRPAPAAAPPVAPPSAFRAPRMQDQKGLDGVIGQPASVLARRFGQARIDLREGDARKLQFVSDTCVLDIYLYPRAAGAEPLATHVEARLRKGGADTDRAGCIREVESARR